MKIIILFFLLFNACSSPSIDRHLVEYNGVEMEQEFIPHVETFERACGKKVNVSIKFADNIFFAIKLFGVDAIGICLIPLVPSIFPRQIYINKDWWDNWNYFGGLGEELILHEIGHCILDRMHTKEMNDYVSEYPRPKSIMYPSIFGYWGWYQMNREEYIKELCQEK